MIAAIYARKSTDDSDRNEEARSTARQIERAREYARAKGWTILDEHVYVDDGISGAEFVKRPGLTKLLAALKIQPPPFQVLIVSEQSRLGRDTLRTLQVIQEVEEAGVKLYSYLDDREVSVGDEMGEVEQFIKSWASAAERRKASQRTRDAVKLRAERGQVPGGRVFGYRNIKVSGHTEREINEQEAAVVRRIFQRRGEGFGAFKIAAELEALGTPSPRGKATWTEAQISIICRNPLYRGELVWGRTRAVKRKGTTTRIDSPESVIRVQVPHLRIVDEKLWAPVQTRMDEAGEYYKKGLGSSPRVSPGLLSPVIRCGICLGGMYLRKGVEAKTGKAYPSYCCTRNSTKGSKRQGGCTNGHRLPAERADEAIISALEDQFLAGDGEAVVQIIMAELSRMQRNQDDRVSIEANMQETEREISNLMKGLAHVGHSPAISKAIKEREEDIEKLRAQLDQIQVIAGVEIQELMIAAVKRAADWRSYLRSNPIGITQSVLKKLFPVKIKFTPGEHGIWTFEGRVSYGKLIEGLLPKIPRTRPSSNWSSTSRPRKRSASRSRRRSCCGRTR